MGFPDGSVGKEYACNIGDVGSIPGSGGSPREPNLQPAPVFLPGKFPPTEEPGSLQCMMPQRVRQDLATKQQRKAKPKC